MIDLHTHTTFSDGTWPVEKLLKVAEEEKVTTLAITDHDTALPHIKLKNMEKEKIEKLLLSIIEKIEKRDDLLIELTKEIALLRLEIKQNHNL